MLLRDIPGVPYGTLARRADASRLLPRRELQLTLTAAAAAAAPSSLLLLQPCWRSASMRSA